MCVSHYSQPDAGATGQQQEGEGEEDAGIRGEGSEHEATGGATIDKSDQVSFKNLLFDLKINYASFLQAQESGDREGGKNGQSMEDLAGSTVNIVEMVGEKEEQLHLKQLVEAHHIDIP